LEVVASPRSAGFTDCVKTFSHFFECVGPAEDQRQQPRIWLRGLAKVRAEFSLSARGYHLRRGLNLGSVADLLKALGVAGNRAAPSPARHPPAFFHESNPPRPPEAMAGSKRPAVQKPRTPVTVDVLTRSIPLPQEFSLALSRRLQRWWHRQFPWGSGGSAGEASGV